MLISRDYWIEDAESAAATLQNVDHVVPADQNPVLRYLYVAGSANAAGVGFTLERPAGTIVLRGFTPFFVDFGTEGFFVPGTDGDDVRVAVEAGAAGETTIVDMVGVDKPRTH